MNWFYQFQFEGYKYDRFSGKLVKVLSIVSQKFSLVEVTTIATSSHGEPIVTITQELKPIKGRVKLTIVSYSLYLPIESMEMPNVIVST
jgi:hypothetical protein